MKKVVCWLTCAAIMLTSVSTLALAEKKTEKKATKKAAAVDEKKVEKKTEKKAAFANETDKLSYAIGFDVGTNLGKSFQKNDIKVNLEVFMRAFQDGFKENPEALMTPQDIQETLMAFQKSMIAKQGKISEKNLTDSKAFMEANAKKEGVKSLPSGLQYKVLKDGDGPVPQPTDKVRIHYKGTLINGKTFDSSYGKEPLEIAITGGAIEGMSEALKMMKVGSKWELFIPPSLGYGNRPGGPIPPNSVLIFEVELVNIVKEIPSTPATPEKK